MSAQVQVRKDALTDCQIVDVDPGELPDGAIRLKIDSFSVTANNVTYAVVGDGFGYWNFFPAPNGMGIVPMWGHARVSESKHTEIAVGERVYGYIPMAEELDVVPGKVSKSGFVAMDEHRQPMSPIYNQYSRLSDDPEHDPDREGERMIFGPLFKTGFLIEYFMRAESWFGAEQVILTSASSKTAMGLASVAKERSPGIKRIGLTSAGNVGFVERSGLYDEVLAYGDIDNIAPAPSTSVDFAGSANILRAIHTHLGDALKYSCLVGVTHIGERDADQNGDDDNMPGPPPTLFFAPDHAVALFKEVGPEKASAMLAESWKAFLTSVAGSVDIETHSGIEAARDVFKTMVGGTVDPSKGIVIEP